MRCVAVLVWQQAPVFELAVAHEVFGLDRTAMGAPPFELRICAVERPPLRGAAGLTLDTPYRPADAAEADLVIVPGWREPLEEPPGEETLAVLRAAVERGACVASFCSGAFVLAAAGLLDGRDATTHWMYAERLAAAYPKVRVDADRLYVGEAGVWTSAGTAAAIDLCLHLVRLEHGAQAANTIARRMIVPPHRDGSQAQYVELAVPAVAQTADDALAASLVWAQQHLAEPLTVRDLAAQATMAPRTYARRFLAATGVTPLRWLLSQRIAAAQQLLERSDLPVERIAQLTGLGAAANLRLHFLRRVGVTPSAYRRTFAAGAEPALAAAAGG
ncbi:MAG: helix-turn-helix domain-containing protein [Acidimicrobiales bacterium]